ncbi:MAG: helix-turn-helix transcriptional regulator [Spirochaetales bacterium]|nr:helix-turn-helix transcriptional regulator [Spirochaetales bacterium]
MNSELVIFPVKDIQGRLTPFTDRGFKGHSVIDNFSYSKGIIDFQYTLKKGASSPMVFTILTLGTYVKPLDVSDYESLVIKVRESTSKSIQIYLKTFVPGISLPGVENAVFLRHNGYVLALNPGAYEYTINLGQFTIGQWWLDKMNVSYSKLPKENYSKLISYDMQFNFGGSDDILDQHQRIIIERISFKRPFSLVSMLILGFLAFLYSGLGIVAGVRGFLISRQSIPRQKPIDVVLYREQDLSRIREFIKLHYSDPDISTRMLYKFLGIPSEKVYAFVLSEYGMSFKQLINKMRIEEAKRLLLESDLRITDIAMNVGFNEVTYFNLLFRKYVKMTPSDFRDKIQSK